MKRLLTLIIVLLVMVVCVGAGWYFFIRDKSVPLGEAISDALPFGSGDNMDTSDWLGNTSPATTTGDTTIFDQFGSPKADVFRLSDSPVAGSVVFKRNTQEIVRYVDRATGHIYEIVMPTASSTQLDKSRITNNTLPKIYEAYFKSDGTAVLVRTLQDDTDVIENQSLVLTAPSAKATSTEFYTITSTAIRGDIGSMAVVGSSLVYVLEDNNSITSSAFNGSGIKALYTSAFTDWQLHPQGNNILVETSASANLPGYVYSLSSSGGSLSRVLGPLNGLVAISNTAGNRIAYSYFDNDGSSKAFVKNLQNNTVSDLVPTTLAEKCVWSTKKVDHIYCAAPADEPTPGSLDLWYAGSLHFKDLLWSIDTKSNVGEIIADPSNKPGVDMDVVDIHLSPDEDYLIFTNKTDLSLWAVRLEKF